MLCVAKTSCLLQASANIMFWMGLEAHSFAVHHFYVLMN